jgi:hypothetical protein
VRAIIAHSDIAAKALQREWPKGIPGLKVINHSFGELDLIQKAIEKIEADYSVPFGETWIDPAVKESMRNHPSNGKVPRAKTLMTKWLNEIVTEDVKELSTVVDALYPFADLPENEWSDSDIDLILLGSIRAIGLESLRDLTAAFALASGTAILLFDENGNPILRVPKELDESDKVER